MSQVPTLVSSDWLAGRLDDPDLRVLESTVFLTLDPAGGDVTIEGGEAAWAESHIPGSAFVDLGELSDPDYPGRFNLPTPEVFSARLSALGVGPGTRVVVYDRVDGEWAARLWWMLRVFGFDDVGVLDGGWTAWTAAGGPMSTEPASHAPARFEARVRPELIATREQVAAYSMGGGACLINALPGELHSGAVPTAHGRAGRIPGSVSVPRVTLVDPETNRLLPLEQLRERFEAAGALGSEPLVTYCGGGIAASYDALVLALLGREDVAVYDGSLVEWAEDPDAPLETD